MHWVLLNYWYDKIAVVKLCNLVNVFKSFGHALGKKKTLCFKVFKHNQNMTCTQDYPLKSCAAAEIMSLVFNIFTLKFEEVSQSFEI